VDFLKKRYDALQQYSLFKGMEYSEDKDKIRSWMPLVMEGRNPKSVIAATSMKIGTDVNFGELTRSIFNYLKTLEGVSMNFHHEVKSLKKGENGRWQIKVKNLETGDKTKISTRFVFIGAGGGSLPLLEKSRYSGRRWFWRFSCKRSMAEMCQ
jgi:malate dehydrogenase (quinone)